MNVTVSPDPGDNTSITFQVDGLTISDAEPTSSGTAVFSIATVVAVNNSLWDATLQIGSNTPVEAEVQVVESNGSQTIGVTLTDSEVTYCSPTSTGGSGSVTEVTGVTPISVANGTTTPAVSLDNDGITTAKIADDAVTSPKIADDAVTHGKIANLAVEHGKIGLGAVQTTNINDDAVTADKLADTAVTPGSYTTADITVDAQGRITSASTGSPPAGTVTSVTAGSGLTGGTITSSGTIAHQAQPASGTGPAFVKSVEIDTFGHVTSVVGEATAAAYRTETGTDDASNLTTGTVAVTRGGTGSNTSPMISVVTAADAAAARTVLDLGTAATEDVGTSGQNIVQLDNAARLPAVDGSQLTNLPSSGGSTNYLRNHPTRTTAKYFEDFVTLGVSQSGGALDVAMTGSSSWNWKSYIHSDPISNYFRDDDAHGVMWATEAGSYDRGTIICHPGIMQYAPDDGDEILFECRLKHIWNANTNGAAYVSVGAISTGQSDGLDDTNIGPGYSNTTKSGIYFQSSQTYLRKYLKATNWGTPQSPTTTDITSVTQSGYSNNWYRMGVHAKYDSANTKWVVNHYFNGSLVSSDDITDWGSPITVGMVCYNNSDNNSNQYAIDWASLQYNVYRTATTLQLEDI